MTTHTSQFPSYAVNPSEQYVCKYCGGWQALGTFPFHRCRKGA